MLAFYTEHYQLMSRDGLELGYNNFLDLFNLYHFYIKFLAKINFFFTETLRFPD